MYRTKINQIPEELTIVVSVTEPKLLIKILHVTFTGGPVKWNDNDMTGKSLKPYVSSRMTGFQVGKIFLRGTVKYAFVEAAVFLTFVSRELQGKKNLLISNGTAVSA